MTLNRILPICFFTILCTTLLFAQAPKAPAYMSVAYMKSTSPDFLSFEKESWVPVHKALIKAGRKSAWYLYRVKYPAGHAKEYDYVRFNVFTDWAQVEAPYQGVDAFIKEVHPNSDLAKFSANTTAGREMVWEELLQVVDQATVDLAHPPKYIQVNQMKTIPGGQSRYIELERQYFKPFHAQRVKDGLMNNWWLCRYDMPYGEKYEADYVTFNGFDTWAAITAGNPPGFWQKLYGDVDFNTIHDEILSNRATINNELWELVAFAVE